MGIKHRLNPPADIILTLYTELCYCVAN